MKQITLTFSLFLTFALGCNQQARREQDKGNGDTLSIPDVPLMRNLGEPTGDDIKAYDFYLVFTISVPFHNYSLFSVRSRDSSTSITYKSTRNRNVDILQNAISEDTAAPFTSYYKGLPISEIDTLRSLMQKYNLQGLSEIPRKDVWVLDASFYELTWYDGKKLFGVSAADHKVDMDPNFKNFIRDIEDRYNRFFPDRRIK